MTDEKYCKIQAKFSGSIDKIWLLESLVWLQFLSKAVKVFDNVDVQYNGL